MQLQLNECKTCGGVLHRVGNAYICQACGNKWTIDAAEDVHVVDRANAWAALRNGDFDRAAELFEIIHQKEPKDHEAFWGLALACAGIMYVVDYEEHKKVPTCNNISEDSFLNSQNVKKAIELAPHDIAEGYRQQAEQIERILDRSVRTEKLAIKDIKLRTFITEGASRNDLAAHVYDITYDTITPEVDSIAVIDDSIVRGTTLKQSIVKILSRLNPKKIVIVSSSPQVRYPDYYGIDMSRMSEFIAFHAAVALLRERGMEQLLHDTYRKCLEQAKLPVNEMVNCVKDIYAPFTDDEITAQITKMLTPEDCTVPVSIVYQSIEGLHEACPNNKGDWYFSGDYPTAGGNRLVNEAYVAYYNQYVK